MTQLSREEANGITPELIKEHFEYDRGRLIKIKNQTTGEALRSLVVKNRISVNKIAIHQRRLIWIMHNGNIPHGYYVSQIDRSLGNKIENLTIKPDEVIKAVKMKEVAQECKISDTQRKLEIMSNYLGVDNKDILDVIIDVEYSYYYEAFKKMEMFGVCKVDVEPQNKELLKPERVKEFEQQLERKLGIIKTIGKKIMKASFDEIKQELCEVESTKEDMSSAQKEDCEYLVLNDNMFTTGVQKTGKVPDHIWGQIKDDHFVRVRAYSCTGLIDGRWKINNYTTICINVGNRACQRLQRFDMSSGDFAKIAKLKQGFEKLIFEIIKEDK